MLGYLLRFFCRPILGKEAVFLADQIFDIFYEIERGERTCPSLIVQKMLVSAEDHRASKHSGFDIISIFRATYRTLIKGQREGGSTIVQQLVRVLSGNYEKSISRKFKEICLACLVSELVPRNVFPPVYLSIAYYGTRARGYSAVCKLLGVPCQIYDLGNAAKIVARLKYPQPLSLSISKSYKIKKREDYISFLYGMHEGRGVYEYLEAILPVESSTSQNEVSS